MNRRMARHVIAGIAVAVTVTSNPALCMAAQSNTAKEENVYATLEGDGVVNGIYVVNSYDLTEAGNIVDFGTYSSIKNLTSEEPINTDGDQISVATQQGKFYYQGNLESKDMPWTISIRYMLDGKDIPAEELGGKEGKLQIFLSIKENKQVNPTFFEHYLMQVSLSLDTSICQNIMAEGATVANVGSDKQILYNIMPGNEKEIEISADVTDFTMDQISFKGIGSSFDINGDSIDKSGITSETNKIADAAKTLNEGAIAASDGVGELNTGAEKIKEALVKLDSNSESLTSGSDKVLQALTELNKELAKVTVSTESLNQLVAASSSVKSGLEGISNGITQLDSSLSYSTVNKTIWSSLSKKRDGQVTKENKDKLAEAITSEGIMKQLTQLPDSEIKTALISYVTAAQSYVAMEEAYQTGLKTYLDTVKGSSESKSGSAYLAASASQLSASYKEFDEQIQTLESTLAGLTEKMDTLKTSINMLMNEYITLDNGISSYAEGVGAVLTGFSELEKGITSLQNGMNQLKDGTKEFADSTDQIDEIVDEKIDSMINSMTGSDFETVSFVSDKNTNIESVQFVMVSKEIEKPVIVTQEVEEAQKSFFEKLLDLFR